MPIEINRDIRKAYALNGEFSLREIVELQGPVNVIHEIIENIYHIDRETNEITKEVMELDTDNESLLKDYFSRYFISVETDPAIISAIQLAISNATFEYNESLFDNFRDAIAVQNWSNFRSQLELNILHEKESKKNLLCAIARRYNLAAEEENVFRNMLDLMLEADKYKKKNKTAINSDLNDAYDMLAEYAYFGESAKTKTSPTWKQIETIGGNNESIVIFSDHHITAYQSNKNRNFWGRNKELYLSVLKYYASDTEFILVENGDVEECLVIEPDAANANKRQEYSEGRSFPIKWETWPEFMEERYTRRKDNHDNIIKEHIDYYARLITDFNGRFYRISGNHDSYLDDEVELRDQIQQLIGTDVKDILRISRGNSSDDQEWIIMHGHQFDSVCLQHNEPYARCLGEVYSECLSWALEGADRYWPLEETKKWYVGTGNKFNNYLAVETPGVYSEHSPPFDIDLVKTEKEASIDLLINNLINNLDKIRSDSRDWIETLLGHEIAWEYFENSDTFYALTLELLMKDELYKLRHMNEVDLCREYKYRFYNYVAMNGSKKIPKLILGHTHEPRYKAADPTTLMNADHYLNSGSAGRFENLIWCVEVEDDNDKIVSWSQHNGKLKKITWVSEDIDDKNYLVHGDINWY